MEVTEMRLKRQEAKSTYETLTKLKKIAKGWNTTRNKR